MKQCLREVGLHAIQGRFYGRQIGFRETGWEEKQFPWQLKEWNGWGQWEQKGVVIDQVYFMGNMGRIWLDMEGAGEE